MTVALCEACGLAASSPEPCRLVSGQQASPGLPHVAVKVCGCVPCAEARDRTTRPGLSDGNES